MTSQHLSFPWLPNNKYSYPDFDCFWLASFIRLHFNLKPFPDISWVYDMYQNEKEHPPNLIETVMYNSLDIVDTPYLKFALMCLEYNNMQYLGTVIDNYCIFMGKYPNYAFINSKLLSHVKLIGTVK